MGKGGQNDTYEKNGGAKAVRAIAHLLGGLGACSTRKFLSFIPSEIVSGVFSDSVLYSILPL